MTPVHTSLLQLPRQEHMSAPNAVSSDGGAGRRNRRRSVPEPFCNVSMYFDGGRIEQKEVASVLKCHHVGVGRPPLVGDNGDLAGRREFSRDLQAVKGRSVRLPVQGLHIFGLAESFQESNSIAVTIESVDIIKHNRAIALSVCLEIDSEGRGVALDPACRIAYCPANAPTLAQPGITTENQ